MKRGVSEVPTRAGVLTTAIEQVMCVIQVNPGKSNR